MRKIVVASLNKGKYTEIMDVMEGVPIQWIFAQTLNCVPEVEETGNTYRENALEKARAFSRMTKFWALADDSGLEVDALNGLPGIASNRFFGSELSDAEKVFCLLDRLKHVSAAQRTARFRCTAVLVSGDEILAEAEGIIEGSILLEPCGHDGFGYDPVFWVPELSKSFAELSREEKNRISHRGLAMRAIKEFLLRLDFQT